MIIYISIMASRLHFTVSYKYNQTLTFYLKCTTKRPQKASSENEIFHFVSFYSLLISSRKRIRLSGFLLLYRKWVLYRSFLDHSKNARRSGSWQWPSIKTHSPLHFSWFRLLLHRGANLFRGFSESFYLTLLQNVIYEKRPSFFFSSFFSYVELLEKNWYQSLD